MNRVLRCGIDIEELARFERYTRNNDYALIRDICTEREINEFRGDRRVHFALAFSCKEAVFKALGESWVNSDISWKDVELLFIGSGFDQYRVELGGYAQEIFSKNGGTKIEASFEYNEDFVVFQVVLL